MTLYKRALFKRFKDKYAPDEVDKLALLIILAFLTIFSVMGCIEAYATDEEEVSVTTINGLFCGPNNNYFTSSSGNSLLYFEIEKGYIYHISNSSTNVRHVCLSDNAPALNGTYQYLTTIGENDTYNYIGSGGENMYISTSTAYGISVTREKIANYEGAVNDLVENVGTQQIWDVFNISIDYVIVAVAVAFGIFLIVLAIRKVSKGKSEF